MIKAVFSGFALALAVLLALAVFVAASAKVPFWLLPAAFVILALLFKHPKIRP